MVRRWLIRGLTLTLLTLCVGAWVGSYCRDAYVEHSGKWNCVVAIYRGRLAIAQYPTGMLLGSGWFCGIKKLEDDWTYGDSVAVFHALGFSYRRDIIVGTSVTVPFWATSSLSGGVLWLVWRKTRPKYNGKGFPVEVAKKAEGPSVP
jgi:hypothetical protein